MKKTISFALTFALLFAALFGGVAQAAGMEDVAKPLPLKTQKIAYGKGELGDRCFYIDVPRKGKLTIHMMHYSNQIYVYLYDAQGKDVEPIYSDVKAIVGRCYKNGSFVQASWDSQMQRGEGQFSYAVSAGRYYIDFYVTGSSGTDKVLATATFSKDTGTGSNYMFSSEIKVGQTLAMGVFDSLSTVLWKSSNTKVATVTSYGAIKGIKAGTAIITATSGNAELSIRIIVK